MVNVLLDTNIYGKISEDTDQGPHLIERIAADSAFVVLNFRLIRNELRRAPRLLPIYDKLVARRVIDEDKVIKRIADEYFSHYKTARGTQRKQKIINDFKIVACASLKGCDIVCSDDNKTLKHHIAVNAYRMVNLRHKLRTPTFYSYDELKRVYL